MTKKPTTKKPKPPTLKDLATRLGANLRRMDEMGRQITALYSKTNGLDERTDVLSGGVGALIKRANGVDQILSANAATHRDEVARLSQAIVSVQAGQFAHLRMISELETKAKQATEDAMRLELGQMELAAKNFAPDDAQKYPAALSENDVDELSERICNAFRVQPASAICSRKMRIETGEILGQFLRNRGVL